MLKDIIMPRLGDTSTEGWVERWEKSVAQEVEMGEVICVISVDKAAFELESPYDGRLVEVLVKDGDVVPVGTLIGRIEVD
ncbi:MAG: biotin/lipoyl-containing protein [Armatimonadota bacterium]